MNFGQDLGTTDYSLFTTLVRYGVYGIFYFINSKDSKGFNISINQTQGYSREAFTIEWMVLV